MTEQLTANEQMHLVITGRIHRDSGRFGGIACTPDGEYFATVSGKMPKDLPPRVSPRKRAGRPKADAAHVAAYANFEMIQHSTEGRKVAKLETCNVLSIGNPNDTEAQERQMQAKLKKAQAIIVESQTFTQIMWAGDDAGNGRLWMALDGKCQRKPDGGLAIDGFCWACQLGDRQAVYGRIKVG